MKATLQSALEAVGIYYAKRQYMPSGVDWLWDIQRLLGERRLATAIDVGANVGNTARAIKQRFPDAIVHAIEPVASTFEILKRSCGALAGVTAYRLALSDTSGRALMATGPNSELNHLIQADGTSYEQVETVDTETLDRFCSARAIDRIGLLKIDAEGADLKVLQGGKRVLAEGRAAFVLCEVGFSTADERHVHVADLLARLSDAGFRTYAFYD